MSALRRAISFLVLLVAACGGKASQNVEQQGPRSSAGAGATQAGSAAVVGGGSASVPGGGLGSATSGGAGNTSGGHTGSAGDDGGAAAAGEPGASGASDTGGAGPDCLDVCALRGGACCFPGAECVRPSGSCEIAVYSETVHSVSEYSALEEAMAAIGPELLFSFSDADIVAAAAEPPSASRIELRLSAPASASAGAMALEQAYLRPFRVSCAGQSLFVGQVYMLEGAAALDLPVMHVSRAPDQALILRLGAVQGSWLFGQAAPAAARERLDHSELRAALCRSGVLGVLGP